ncbi:hypothetical protein BGZ65_005451 [Modicella reniformis]|uniref:Uncharacterized protein n=1 Tax=Modicella reniformis TaxID=1440133 RepID=A0A9P6LYU0_9FUNG|nr:hypothetical protein BGZ65_005451 [Modicella reniformis]
MAALQNAKEWFKRRRGKKRNAVPCNPNVYIPGIGSPPTRNSSQPTLIPYIPPSARKQRRSEDGSSDDDDDEYDDYDDYNIELDLDEDGLPEFIICRESLNAAASLAVAAAHKGTPSAEYVPDEDDSSHGLLAGSSSSSKGSASGTNSESGAASAATLVSSIPCKPFALGYKHHKHSGSHSSLPTQLPGQQPKTDLTGSPPSNQPPKQQQQSQAQPGPIRHSLTRNLNYLNNRHKRNSEQQWSQAQIQSMPQPELHRLEKVAKSSDAGSTKFSASTETLNAQEYARTVKTLWQMVEDKGLAHRLKDASPVEREWLIFNHKNALFPLKPSSTTANTVRTGSENTRARVNAHPQHASDSRLTPINEASGAPSTQENEMPTPRRRGSPRSKDGTQPQMSSLPNSPVAGPVLSASEAEKKERRSTLLSPMVLQSAMELQKRDHYTIQQRVDMEEDWRMQARLLRTVKDPEERARGVRHVQAQFLQRQQQQRAEGFKEYEPTHEDFNKWFDLKEELDDNDVPDLNDDVRGFDLKEEFEYEDERKEREARELEERKKKELEELEHELNIMGLERFEPLGFVESDSSSSSEQEDPSSSQTQTPEELEKHHQRQILLHQQLQEQCQQLQLQLQQADKKSKKKKLGPAPSGTTLPPPPPGPRPPANASTNANANANTNANVVAVQPLKPRNGRKMFANDCDSMIIKDMPVIAPATH